MESADCFVENLTPTPMFDMAAIPWSAPLEAQYRVVLDELVEYEKKRRQLEGTDSDLSTLKPTVGQGEEGDGDWMGPRFAGKHYGPEWRTLALQVWCIAW